MNVPRYSFRFSDAVDMRDVEETLLMSVIAAEAVHGRARVRLDARFSVDATSRSCAVGADSVVGQDIAKVFTEFLLLDIGESAFEINGAGAQRGRHVDGMSDRWSR